ncbi:hypothetical protein, partial [Ruegeria faecimaris]|uniref:hypothetical protein n=1 Tax=Ruegeria faecimaris TaxID=686389 RepID=UPI0024903038
SLRPSGPVKLGKRNFERQLCKVSFLRKAAVSNDSCCNRGECQLSGHLLNARFGLHEDRGWEYFYK